MVKTTRRKKENREMMLPEDSLAVDEKNEKQVFIEPANLHSEQFPSLRNYKGFWLTKKVINNIERLGDGFAPRPSDVFIASSPKCGTTWLKSLAFAACNRKKYSPLTSIPHPLLTLNPHECVPHVEMISQGMDLSFIESMPSPRILATHLTPSILPKSFTDASTNYQIIYVCRDPKDAFTSSWHFYQTLKQINGKKQLLFADTFESFCSGKVPYGPIWDHVLEFWRESQRKPNYVLFLRYEEVIEDPKKVIRMIAQFMGCEFSKEEENMGLVNDLVRLCSFDCLSNTEENKHGQIIIENQIFKKSSFFRKGQIGNWVNHLTPEMGQRLDKITQEKFKGSGLNF